MKHIDLNHFKKLLEEQLHALRDLENENAITAYGEEKEPLDRGDQGNKEANQTFLLRMKAREERLVKKIEDALKRIETGEYGTCILCGEEIPVERLNARPVALRCIGCKEKEEKLKP